MSEYEYDPFWTPLMNALDDEHSLVIPLLGRDVLTVQTDKGDVPYHTVVAAQVAKNHGIDVATLPQPDLHSVKRAIDQQPGSGRMDPRRLQSEVFAVHRSLRPTLRPGETLRALVKVPAFRLFVTCAWDVLLEDALLEERKRPAVAGCFRLRSDRASGRDPSERLGPLPDYDSAAAQRASGFVYYLLGRIHSCDRFGATEGEVLEFVHALTKEWKLWANLGEVLKSSHLLLIGINFPDWLARFILKLARPDPLWADRPRQEFIVNTGNLDEGFLEFLRSFPGESQVYSGGSIASFATELGTRWTNAHPEGAPTTPPTRKLDDVRAGAVFVSYASADREAALLFCATLRARGLDVWVDTEGIQAGDRYPIKLPRAIETSCAFVALLSHHSLSVNTGFRREWKQAGTVDEKYHGDTDGFIFPVIIDDSSMDEMRNLSEHFRNRTVTYAPEGRITEESADLVAKLDKVQKLRRSGRGLA
jgi:hypothetical protein